MHRDIGQSGYSLVEVLVAFLILAMALAVLFRLFSAGLRNATVSEEYARAALVAETQLALAAGDQLTESYTEGVEADKYRWTRSIEPYRPYANYSSRFPDIAALEINVSVEWPAGGTNRRIDLSTIRIPAAGARQ
jgi:general secretion pathway protein I